MNNLNRYGICAVAVSVLFSFGNTVQAQSTQNQRADEVQLNTITTAVPFLLITPDSRAGGMGDVGVASSTDVNSIHWNPSKLAFADKKMGIGGKKNQT